LNLQRRATPKTDVGLVELLEEKGLMKQEEVLERIRLIKNRKEPS